jgi:hypothetical protein
MKKTILGIVLFFTVLTQGWGVVLFRSASSDTSNGDPSENISLTIVKPAGVVANDVLIASIAFGPDSSTLEIPSGWILLRAISQPSGNGNNLSVFYRVAVSNEPVDYSWIITKHGQGDFTIGIAGGIAAFSGVDISDPIDAESGVATPSSLQHSTSITTTVTYTMLVASFEYASSGTWTPPLDMLETVDVGSETRDSGEGISLEINYGLQVLAGETVVKTAIASANEDTGAADIVALRPSIHPPIPPTCNLSNGISLSTYDISGYSHAYPIDHAEFDALETNYAIDSLKFGSGAVDNINTTGSNNTPYQNDPDEKYLSIFDGYIYIPSPGAYSFAVNGDDAVEVILDSNQYYGWYGSHESDDTSHNQIFTFLYAGYYKIKFRHQEWTGEDNYQLYWKNLTDIASAYEIVPKSSLFYCSFSKPVVDYRFDECTWNGTATDVKDSSGSGFNATSVNGASTQSSTAAGGGICHVGLFQSANNQYVNAGNVLNPDSNDWSVSVWVKWNGENGEQIIYNKENLYEARVKNGYFEYAWQPHWNWDGGQSIPVSQGVWTHFVITYDHSTQKVYEDGALMYSRNQTGDIGTNNDSLLIGARGNTSPQNYFNGNIDELKMFDKALDATQVLDIYNNEKAQKNYEGTLRTCSVCIFTPVTYKFDVWDTFRKINDRNISTKIVSQEFNLTIASLDENNIQSQDFNGTVCTSVVGDKNQTWIKSTFNDINTTSVSYMIANAVKDTRIDIRWWKNTTAAGVTCNDGSEDNKTLSTDNFAIRPLKFTMDLNTTSFYAGVPFHIDINASNLSGANSVDYNETNGTSFIFAINDSNATCASGALGNLPTPFKFSNGNISFDTNYSDVGDVIFNIKENNGSEFAFVDRDDTNDSERLIQEYNTSITVSPYQFAIVDYNFTRSPDQDWRYMSDVNESNITVSFNVQAQNMGGEVTPKFDAKCYATDVNVTIDLTSTDLTSTSSDGNISYYRQINNSSTMGDDINLSDINWTDTINDQNFTDGNSSKVVYALNVYRERNNLKNPLNINIADINTTDATVKNIGVTPENNGSKFYYGRVKTKDISTNKQTASHSLIVEVYSTSKVKDFHQESLNWYVMEDDNNKVITDLNDSTKFDTIVDTTLNTSVTDYTKGVLNFNLENPNKVQSAYIHVAIPSYLWSSRYNDYNATGDCSMHPCFKYNYVLDTLHSGISSGAFNGTSIGKDYNATKTKKGVKVFR